VLGPFSIAKIIGVAAIAAYAIHYFISGEERKLVNAPQNIYVFLLLAAVVVSDIVAIDPEYAVDKTFKLVRVMAFYFLVINVVRTRASMHRVLWILVVTGLISASFGLYEYYFTPEVLDDLRITGTYDDRLAWRMRWLLLPIVVLFKHNSKPVARIFLSHRVDISLQPDLDRGAQRDTDCTCGDDPDRSSREACSGVHRHGQPDHCGRSADHACKRPKPVGSDDWSG
jgi:hypothetical protein